MGDFNDRPRIDDVKVKERELDLRIEAVASAVVADLSVGGTQSLFGLKNIGPTFE